VNFMSNLYYEWNKLSIKIKSLIQVSTFYFNHFDLRTTNDSVGIFKHSICPSVHQCCTLIKDFSENTKHDSFFTNVHEILLKFISDNEDAIDPKAKALERQNAFKVLVNLALLETTITYYLTNTQTRIRKNIEIAFQHLQRQLISDEAIKSQWQKEDMKETDFEKLGGSHLLLHKIWGFKANASGERTDLVLSEKINEDDPLLQAVDSLVLTEWKHDTKTTPVGKLIDQAKKQAARYAYGSLGSIELSNYCYLVIVSSDCLEKQVDIIEDGRTYRVINIALSPKTPSKS
jgi:hypothetical protein